MKSKTLFTKCCKDSDPLWLTILCNWHNSATLPEDD